MDPEIEPRGGDALVIGRVLEQAVRRILLLPDVDALQANERREVELVALVDVVGGLDVRAFILFGAANGSADVARIAALSWSASASLPSA